MLQLQKQIIISFFFKGSDLTREWSLISSWSGWTSPMFSSGISWENVIVRLKLTPPHHLKSEGCANLEIRFVSAFGPLGKV